MKEFLFSRSHKKHYSNAVVRMGKNNLGFSLVELIIVIAIMAILVAVAIPVFGVFIQKAEKSNDQNVVKDIVYAIELANKSGAFMEEQSRVMGNFEYPVAFIVLNESGMQILTSGTEISYVDPCEFATVENVTYLVEKNTVTCEKNGTGTAYEKKTETITYCTKHSTEAPAQLDTDYPYYSEITTSTSSWVSCGKWVCTKHDFSNDKISSGTMFADPAKVYSKSANESMCTYAYKNRYGIVDMNTIGTVAADNTNPVYKALEDAFGENFLSNADLKLSGEWEAVDDLGYAPLYTSAPELMEKIEGLADKVVNLCNYPGVSSVLSLASIQKYNSSEELFTNFSDAFMAMYGPEVADGYTKWLTVWNNIPKEVYTSGGFGFSYREHYSACRFAYNSAFASYCEMHGIDEKYLTVLRDYYREPSEEVSTKNKLVFTAAQAVGLNFPATITYDAFNNDASGLKQMFVDAKDSGKTSDSTTETDDIAIFKEVQALYQDYVKSTACTENALAFYNTIVTVDDTADSAGIGETFFDYYEGHLKDMSALYSDAQTLAGKNGIIIIVTVQNGVAECKVTPAAADFRNQ